MEDPESKDTTPILTTPTSGPVTIFGRPFRMQNDSLYLRELHRLCVVVLAVVSVCTTAVCFQRAPVLASHSLNIRWLPILATYTTTIMYLLDLSNVYMGGWGDSNGRFWCDVKIMYVRGFNTIRTVCRFFGVSLMFSLLAVLLDVQSSLVFIVMLVVISEWQSGLAENQNQYDIKFEDKFVDEENKLSVEVLHQYQATHSVERVTWVSFTIASIIKIMTLSCMFIPVDRNDLEPTTDHPDSGVVFRAPVIVGIVLWSFLLPCLLDFAYFKQTITFCQLEIYRMLTDCCVLTLTCMFTLV